MSEVINKNFLVSCCNTRRTFCLLGFNIEEGFKPIPLEILDDPRCVNGATGILNINGLFLIALQGSPARLLVLDSRLTSGQIVNLDHARDVHGLAALGDSFLVVSTGTNQVLRYGLDFKFLGVFGIQAEFLADTEHLNDLSVLNERVLVNYFGAARSSGLRKGGIKDAESGMVVFSGLNESHSISEIDGRIYVLDSATGHLLGIISGVGAVREASILGYARGLHVSEDFFLIGRSAHRNRGRTSLFQHSAKLTATRAASLELGQGGIFLVPRDGTQHQFFPLGPLGREIYAICPV